MADKLAVDGGKPVRDTFLPYGKQSISDADIKLVEEVLRSDWITTGPVLRKFENEFAQYTGSKFAVAVSSGTSALHLAMLAAGLKKGHEAITTPFSFAATSNSVIYTGAKPVFSDIEAITYNLDPKKAGELINDRTKAIVPVDYAGHPCAIDEFRDMCEDDDLVFIQDACHSVSAKYKGRRMGGLSDMTCFSFHPVKNMTTGEGGMVTTNNEEYYERLLMLRNHGINKDGVKRFGSDGGWYYEMQELGFNYRMTDIQAALGLGQLRKLEQFHQRRKGVVAVYDKELSGIEGVAIPFVSDDVEHGWHLFTLLFDKDYFSVDRGTIFKALRAENIGVNVHYIPIHHHPYYQDKFGDMRGQYLTTEKIASQILTIPLHHTMSAQDVQDTIEAVKKVTDHYRTR